MAGQTPPRARTRVIDEVLADLAQLKAHAPVGEQYAIDANIEFFTACRSVLGYIHCKYS
jgi:hypothetical protein